MDLLAGLTGGPAADGPTAVRIGGAAVSRAELLDHAGATATRLEPGRPFAVEAHASLDTVATLVAGLLAGAPVIPMPPDAGPAERDHILSDSRKASIAGPEPPALIVYTSGTTGPPKGAMLSSAALAHDLDALAEAWEWTPADHLVHGLPLYHVHGLVLGVLGALRLGCRLTHTGRPTPEAYAAAADEGGSLFFGVPTVWTRLCASPAHARALRGARLLVSGSAALSAETFAALRDLTGHDPVERYGMTETLITVSARADRERRPGWVGWALPGVETRVVPDEGADGSRPEPGEESEVGELQVRGATLFDGYVGRPPTTGFTEDGWFRTGDAAGIDARGCHRIVGRISTDLIKTGGFRVAAGEVEDALLAHPSVSEAAVVGVPDPDLGQRIVAYVVGSGADGRALQDWVALHLSVHKRPREVRFVDALPRNALGKVQKARLSDDGS